MSKIRKTLASIGLAIAAAIAPIAAAPQAEAVTLTGKCDPSRPGVYCSMDQARVIYSTSSVTYGANNVYVYRLQKSLTWIGLPVSWTGYFGPATKAALLEYQRTRKITQTGTLDTRTLSYLQAGAGAYLPYNTTSPSPTTPITGTCQASYYYQGQITASGEWFNPYGMTAAHKTYPFGTRLKVTNRANGKSVIVRINDRGPYISGRCLDLSLGAFQTIANTSSGVISVNYTKL